MPGSGGAGTYYIGIDVGVTDVKTACVRRDGEAPVLELGPTNATNPDWPQAVKRRVRMIEEKLGAARGIGVAAPGIAAPDGESIFWMQGRLDEVQGLDWAKLLGRDRVPVLNDAQAALAGEAWQGAGKGAHNVARRTRGSGAGGGLMAAAGC